MTTAVLDLDFDQLPRVITGLEGYSYALILVRLSGQPVGQVRLPVAGGRINGSELHQTVVEAADSAFWERWLHCQLGWEQANPTRAASPTATIAVCTRDRPDDVRRCLEALMRLPNDGQEILVVDNCPSTDATRRIVQEFSWVRYVVEPRPGLNNARNRALYEARHEIIAFADDDAVPDPGWLRALLRNYDHPLTLCVTGLTMPLELETEAQELFERYISFMRGFEYRAFDEAFKKPLAVGRCGVGTNMSVRRSLLKWVGPFDEALDAGTPTRSGGDNDMFSRILASGYRIVYDPAALSWHRHRTSMAELKRQLHGYGVGNFATWTRNIFIDGEPGALKEAQQAVGRRLNDLLASLRREPNRVPLNIIAAILLGYAMGPWAYYFSRRRFPTRSWRL
ncbi:MAG TPA: glycosyltransferase [Anaerolineae bacterium]|jgi:GT2 family glycosyltransferase